MLRYLRRTSLAIQLRLGVDSSSPALTLWLALRDANIGGLRSALGYADRFWILLAGLPCSPWLLSSFAGVLFHPESAGLSWTNLAGAFLVGQMLNILLPIRLGEMARAYWIGRTEGIPIGRALGTIGVEKLADLASVGLTAVALLLLAGVPPWVQSPGRVLVITGAIAAAGILVLAANRGVILQIATRAAQRWPQGIGRRLIDLLETTLEGSRALPAGGERRRRPARSSCRCWVPAPTICSSSPSICHCRWWPRSCCSSRSDRERDRVGPRRPRRLHYVTVLTLGTYWWIATPRWLTRSCYLVAVVPKILAGVVWLACAQS